MKFLKNMFGTKPIKKPKNEPNTLAEANGSPDLRLATAKEKEVDIPVIKQDTVKKIPKKSSTSTAEKPKAPTTKKTTNTTVSETEKKKESKPSSTTTTKTIKKTDTSDSSTTPKKTAPKTQSTTTKDSTTTQKKTASKPKTTNTVAEKSTSEPKDTTKKSNKNTTSQAEKNTQKVSEKTAMKTTKTDSSTTTKKPAEEKKSASKTTKNAPTTTKKTNVNNETKPVTEQKNNTKKQAAQVENNEEITVTKSAKTGKFEIKKSKDGRFVFNLYASNNVIVATSQVYSSSTSAMNGIKSVIANAASAPVEDQTLKKVTEVPFPKWEIYLDKSEEYRFRLCASNGSCVCHSQGYTSKANCKKGIESIIKFAADAEITKAYLEKKEK